MEGALLSSPVNTVSYLVINVHRQLTTSKLCVRGGSAFM
jgi:hypothetical protein